MSGDTDRRGKQEAGTEAARSRALPMSKTKNFTNRYPYFGPAMWMLAITFFAAQVAVAYRWQNRAVHATAPRPYHPYSFFANTISDLGETSKFGYGNPPMWSPDHLWMNLSFVLLGLLMIVGSPLIYQEFTESSGWRSALAGVGFAAQALAGAGAIVVGLVPENVHPLAHEVGAALAIAVGTLGVSLLAFALPLPGRLRRFMIWCSPVSLVAILLYGLHEYLGFGPGGMERVAAYPEVIWLIMFGFYISYGHYEMRSAGEKATTGPTPNVAPS